MTWLIFHRRKVLPSERSLEASNALAKAAREKPFPKRIDESRIKKLEVVAVDAKDYWQHGTIERLKILGKSLKALEDK